MNIAAASALSGNGSDKTSAGVKSTFGVGLDRAALAQAVEGPDGVPREARTGERVALRAAPRNGESDEAQRVLRDGGGGGEHRDHGEAGRELHFEGWLVGWVRKWFGVC